MTNKNLSIVVLAFSCLHLYSCITVAPVHGSYEKAGTLGKGNTELAGSYSHYIAGAEGESKAINNNIGIRAGYGLSNKVDIKARYEKLMVVDEDLKGKFKADYFSLVPKINFIPGELSLFVPISMYSFKNTSETDVSKGKSYSIASHLIRTFTNKLNTVDFSGSLNMEYLWDDASGDFLMGANIGAGFSSDLRKWAIRPEIGYLFKPGESGHIWNMGVALQVTLPTGKK